MRPLPSGRRSRRRDGRRSHRPRVPRQDGRHRPRVSRRCAAGRSRVPAGRRTKAPPCRGGAHPCLAAAGWAGRSGRSADAAGAGAGPACPTGRAAGGPAAVARAERTERTPPRAPRAGPPCPQPGPREPAARAVHSADPPERGGGAIVGRLVIRRGPGVVGAPTVPEADAATLRTGAGAFSARLELVTAPALDAATAFLATPPPEAVPVAGTGSDLSDAFLAGGCSSGWTGRRKPSASAFRRTRSACASSMEDEWLFTPIPRDSASSSPSLFVRPSSLASS